MNLGALISEPKVEEKIYRNVANFISASPAYSYLNNKWKVFEQKRKYRKKTGVNLPPIQTKCKKKPITFTEMGISRLVD